MPTEMKNITEDAKSNCFIMNDGNSCVLRALVDEGQCTRRMPAPTVKVPLKKGYFARLADLEWPSDTITFELLIGVMFTQTKLTCASQEFYDVEGELFYCAGLLKPSKSGLHLFGRNSPKVILVRLPQLLEIAVVSLASESDSKAISKYKDLVIIHCDKQLCEKRVSFAQALLYR